MVEARAAPPSGGRPKPESRASPRPVTLVGERGTRQVSDDCEYLDDFGFHNTFYDDFKYSVLGDFQAPEPMQTGAGVAPAAPAVPTRRVSMGGRALRT